MPIESFQYLIILFLVNTIEDSISRYTNWTRDFDMTDMDERILTMIAI